MPNVRSTSLAEATTALTVSMSCSTRPFGAGGTGGDFESTSVAYAASLARTFFEPCTSSCQPLMVQKAANYVKLS